MKMDRKMLAESTPRGDQKMFFPLASHAEAMRGSPLKLSLDLSDGSQSRGSPALMIPSRGSSFQEMTDDTSPCLSLQMSNMSISDIDEQFEELHILSLDPVGAVQRDDPGIRAPLAVSDEQGVPILTRTFSHSARKRSYSVDDREGLACTPPAGEKTECPACANPTMGYGHIGNCDPHMSGAGRGRPHARLLHDPSQSNAESSNSASRRSVHFTRPAESDTLNGHGHAHSARRTGHVVPPLDLAVCGTECVVVSPRSERPLIFASSSNIISPDRSKAGFLGTSVVSAFQSPRFVSSNGS